MTPPLDSPEILANQKHFMRAVRVAARDGTVPFQLHMPLAKLTPLGLKLARLPERDRWMVVIHNQGTIEVCWRFMRLGTRRRRCVMLTVRPIP